MLDLIATQLGLSRLRNDVKQALNYIPNKVDELLTTAIHKIATSLPGRSADPLFKGKLDGQALQPFEYPDPNTKYVLWAARDGAGVKVKIAKVVGSGYDFIGELKASSFENTTAVQAHINALLQKANALDNLLRSPQTADKTRRANIKQTQIDLRAAEALVVEDIKANACKALNTGCFAAGTKLWTPDGYRNVEDIQANQFVFARNEFDPNGDLGKSSGAVEVRDDLAGAGGEGCRPNDRHNARASVLCATQRARRCRADQALSASAGMCGQRRVAGGAVPAYERLDPRQRQPLGGGGSCHGFAFGCSIGVLSGPPTARSSVARRRR